jgi:alpha-maltose-1-phosphate synthase
MNNLSPFAVYFAGDAYSTTSKIMGRQSAGKAFMKGLARTYPNFELSGIGNSKSSAIEMAKQLNSNGFTGQLKWSTLPNFNAASEAGTLYYPAPPARDIAAARNLVNPASFGLMGVTHTLSSNGAMDQIADLVLPPFCNWDALICTSEAAKNLVVQIQEEMRDFWRASIGATKFVNVNLPVIPLGVDVPAFEKQQYSKPTARLALDIDSDEVAFLFAGRLSFHAKANPAPVYQALEKISKETRIVCIEAGVFPNNGIRQAYLAAQKLLAPSVRFIWVDGHHELQFQQAWQAADVFVSLSDNIQETFGLTPVEAMAAGLPVVVSDWNGYKDTVRDGIDGFRVPTISPPPPSGADLALRAALGIDTYDFYIGRTSLATVVDPAELTKVLRLLAFDLNLRIRMGTSGQLRAKTLYDWPIIIGHYAQLADELNLTRDFEKKSAVAQRWPQRVDPFERFAHFSTKTLSGHALVHVQPAAKTRLKTLMTLSMTSYAFNPDVLNSDQLIDLLNHLLLNGAKSVNTLLKDAGLSNPIGVRALLWLWKFDVVSIENK